MPVMKILGFLTGYVGLCLVTTAQPARSIFLEGEWRFAVDRKNEGVAANWFNQSLPDRIKLPGVLQSQGFGDEISATTPWVLSLYDRAWDQRADYQEYTKPGNVKVPFLSQPPRHYIGPAWYQRDITVPAAWRGKRVVFEMERPKWETTVWLNDKRIGSRRSLVAPHEYDLGIIEPGTYRLSVRVDTSMILPYRPDAHGVFGNDMGRARGVTRYANGLAVPLKWSADRITKVEFSNSYPGHGRLQNWNEFTPTVSTMSFSLRGESADDKRDVTFGFREIKAVGKEFQINGRPVYFARKMTGRVLMQKG